MTAQELQEKFADVLASETVYIPNDPEYIGQDATETDLTEYEEYVREMTGVEPVRTWMGSNSPTRSESVGMIALQDALWYEWCRR